MFGYESNFLRILSMSQHQRLKKHVIRCYSGMRQINDPEAGSTVFVKYITPCLLNFTFEAKQYVNT